MLNEIAAADYGYKAEENLAPLWQIRGEGLFVTPLRWRPREVLELIRWSNPEDPKHKPGLPGERGHWMRAFACSALLRAAGEVGNEDLRSGWNQTLMQLIGSLRAVGPELYEPAAAFLAWLVLRVDADGDTEELGFLMMGLLWFALHLRSAIPDDVVVALAERIAAEAQRSARRWDMAPERWLLGTTFFDKYHADWERLGVTLAEIDLGDRSSDARDWVGLIGSELAGSNPRL